MQMLFNVIPKAAGPPAHRTREMVQVVWYRIYHVLCTYLYNICMLECCVICSTSSTSLNNTIYKLKAAKSTSKQLIVTGFQMFFQCNIWVSFPFVVNSNSTKKPYDQQKRTSAK